MGIEYFLCDKDRGEAFELGKGWFLEGDSESDFWPRCDSPQELIITLRSGFYFLREDVDTPHPDHAYARRAAARLWLWLEGRDQSRLNVRDDCNDDVFCRSKLEACHEPQACDDLCLPELGARHYFVTGSRFDPPDGWVETDSYKIVLLAETLP